MTSPVKKLGRKIPLATFDHGQFRVVKTADGKTHYFPRFSAHYNRAKDLAPPPAAVDYSAKAAAALAQMYLNDQLGDCVIASRYHNLGIVTGNESGAPVIATDAEVQNAYTAACGPGDNGCNMADVNQYRQTTGIVAAGQVHKTAGSASVDNTNENLVKVCIDLFGGLNVGINLPQAWYQSNNGDDWGPVTGADGQIVGGHEIQAVGYSDKGVKIATWGGWRTILWAAFTAPTWVSELYVELSPEWYANAGLAPNGVDVKTLQAALAAVANGQVPVIPDPTPVVPPVVPPTPVVPPVVPPTPVVPPVVPPAPVANAFTGTMAYSDGVLTSVGTGRHEPMGAGGAFTFTGQTVSSAVTVALPVGVFGALENVNLTLPAVPVTGTGVITSGAPKSKCGARAQNEPSWVDLKCDQAQHPTSRYKAVRVGDGWDGGCGKKAAAGAYGANGALVAMILEVALAILPLFGIPVPTSLIGVIAVIEAGIAQGLTIKQIIDSVIASLVPVPLGPAAAFVGKK